MGRVTTINNQPPSDMAEENQTSKSDSSAPSGRVHPLVGRLRWVREENVAGADQWECFKGDLSASIWETDDEVICCSDKEGRYGRRKAKVWREIRYGMEVFCGKSEQWLFNSGHHNFTFPSKRSAKLLAEAIMRARLNPPNTVAQATDGASDQNSTH